MIIDYRTDAKNSYDSGWATVDSRQIFNFDGFIKEHDKEEQEFLNTLTTEWKEIPEELLDLTTRQNFICYARLSKTE